MSHYAEKNSQDEHRILDDDPLAIRLLKEQHQTFRVLFDRANAAEGDELVRTAQEICMRLDVHMVIEEEILYPALKEVLEADEVNEGIVEHGTGKVMAAEIEQLDGTEELYKSKVHVLGEVTMHHLDEEDGDMFEDAKEAHRAGKIDLEEIGRTLEARQAELYREIAEQGEAEETDEDDVEEIPAA
jgi:hypothetical protein